MAGVGVEGGMGTRTRAGVSSGFNKIDPFGFPGMGLGNIILGSRRKDMLSCFCDRDSPFLIWVGGAVCPSRTESSAVKNNKQ